MSARAKAFLDGWIRKNLKFSSETREETVTADAETEALADGLATEAEAAGIPRDELEAEFGDLTAYIQQRLDARG
jgi:nucleotide-binding universal stress UspA family protein